jgi:AhpD family alkylhydroperoxidase
MWARAPKVFLAVALLYGMIDRRSSPIDQILRSLITVRVSQLNGCRFCVDIDSATLLKRGVPLDKIEALNMWQTSGHFTDRERVCLEYAAAVTLRSNTINEASFQNLSSKFNSVLRVPPQGFCRFK